MRSGRQLQLERLLFFTDAVFAIAITLLVIEIRLPPLPKSDDASLILALVHLIPHYVGFIVSFFVIGRFWRGHHRVMGYLADWDDGLVTRNFLLLFTVAFMPFPTAVVTEMGPTRVAVLAYVGWLTVAGLANLALITYVMRRPDLLNAALTPDQIRQQRAVWLPLAIAATAGAATIADPLWGIAALVISPLMFTGLLAVVNRVR